MGFRFNLGILRGHLFPQRISGPDDLYQLEVFDATQGKIQRTNYGNAYRWPCFGFVCVYVHDFEGTSEFEGLERMLREDFVTYSTSIQYETSEETPEMWRCIEEHLAPVLGPPGVFKYSVSIDTHQYHWEP